jgi:hypothetical protein
MSLRSFLLAVPFVIGLRSPLLMLVASLGLIPVLARSDRPPPVVGEGGGVD